MSNRKGLFSNIASLGLVQIANYILPLLSVPIISRIIGPDKFGVINYTTAFTAYFTLLINFGFEFTATRIIAQNPQDQLLRNKTYSNVLSAKVLLLAVSTIIFTASLWIVPPISAEKSVSIFSFLLCFSTVLNHNWMFQAMQQLKNIALLSMVGKILFTVFILLVIRKQEDYVWYPLVFGCSQLLVDSISLLWARKKYQLHYIPVQLTGIMQMLRQGRTVFFSLVVVNLYTSTNIVLLGLMKPPVEVGYFSGGQRLMLAMYSVINMPLSMALFPFIGKAFSEDRDKGLQAVQKVLPLISSVTFIAGIGLLIISPYFLPLFYGEQFRPSIVVMQILAFLPFVISLNNVMGIQIMLNLHMDKLFFNITAIGALVSITLNIILVQLIGYVGTAIDWMFTEILITTLMFIALKKRGISVIDKAKFKPSNIKQQVLLLLHK